MGDFGQALPRKNPAGDCNLASVNRAPQSGKPFVSKNWQIIPPTGGKAGIVPSFALELCPIAAVETRPISALPRHTAHG
jgi:hypothetical protein